MNARKTNCFMDKVMMGAIMGFEDVCQLKWFPLTHLWSNWQLTNLTHEVSHNN